MRTKPNLAAVQDKTNLNQRREEQRKASEAGGDTQVLEYIANKHGISKSELLDREADDLAVRIALEETPLITEAKKVNIAALEECASGKTENIKRSSHVIMVKNLPWGSSEGDLASIFGKFGSLDKVILPPNNMLALVIFLEAAAARVAFKSLAHRLYKDLPLYLEWAPENVLSPDTTSDRDERKNVISEKNINSILLQRSAEGIHKEDIDPDRVEVKGLRLPKKFGSHRGFAVVECVTKQEAQNAIQSLSSTHLYGRHLVIEGAEEGESLEKLRARTAAQFVDEQSGFQKLSKKRKHMATLDEGTAKFATPK